MTPESEPSLFDATHLKIKVIKKMPYHEYLIKLINIFRFDRSMTDKTRHIFSQHTNRLFNIFLKLTCIPQCCLCQC